MTLEDLYRLLRSGHVQAQGVMDTLDEPLLVLDQSMCVAMANPAFLRTFRVERDETVGHSLFSLGNGEWDIPDLRQLLSNVIPRAAAIVDYEMSHDFPHIGRHTFLITARKLSHPDDNSQHLLIVFTNVTRRRRESEAKDILLDESRHRMKNLLAVVRAMVSQTRTDGLSADQYQETVLGRLGGLAIAHDLTMDESEAVDFETLARRVLAPFADRISFRPGPAVSLHKDQVQPLGLSLHELATNAAKYGSLSVAEGTISLSWDRQDQAEQRELSIVWLEENGPAVTPPDHEGFGAGLIKHSVVYDMNGDLDTSFERQGLKACIRLPIIVDGE